MRVYKNLTYPLIISLIKHNLKLILFFTHYRLVICNFFT
jgi:hypothetical protein